jgi:hypothetical protein
MEISCTLGAFLFVVGVAVLCSRLRKVLCTTGVVRLLLERETAQVTLLNFLAFFRVAKAGSTTVLGALARLSNFHNFKYRSSAMFDPERAVSYVSAPVVTDSFPGAGKGRRVGRRVVGLQRKWKTRRAPHVELYPLLLSVTTEECCGSTQRRRKGHSI